MKRAKLGACRAPSCGTNRPGNALCWRCDGGAAVIDGIVNREAGEPMPRFAVVCLLCGGRQRFHTFGAALAHGWQPMPNDPLKFTCEACRTGTLH